jgi:hypothetical protein
MAELELLHNLLSSPPHTVNIEGIPFQVYDFSGRSEYAVVLSTPGYATGIDEITTEEDEPEDEPDTSFVTSDLPRLLEAAREEGVLVLHISLLSSSRVIAEGEVREVNFPEYPELNN